MYTGAAVVVVVVAVGAETLRKHARALYGTFITVKCHNFQMENRHSQLFSFA